MSDNSENEVTETPEEKPKKTRKPRAKKAAAAPAPAPAEKPKRAPKASKFSHEVKHEGRCITVTGTDVKVRDMTPAQLAEFGIKSVEGALGKACAEPVVLTFKSPAAASKFFAASFTAEDEADEFIVAGAKTDWHGEDLSNVFG